MKLVLLVEDDALDEELLRMALRRKTPYDLQVARDGHEALQFLLREGPFAARPARPPDLVILDLQLPKLSDLEVLTSARARPELATVPIVVLSSSREPRDLEACARAGANSFVWKSADPARFNESVALLERYWLDVHERPR